MFCGISSLLSHSRTHKRTQRGSGTSCIISLSVMNVFATYVCVAAYSLGMKYISGAVSVRRSKGQGVWTADKRITSRPDGVTFMTQFIAASGGLGKFAADFGTTPQFDT